jgi:glutaredoxin 3
LVKIEIYTTQTCPFCHAAKDLLQAKAVAFDEIDVVDPAMRAAMSARADGRTSVPQIFINGTHIGGCDDLYMLEETGKLGALLADDTATDA